MSNIVFVASPLRALTKELFIENQEFALDFCKNLWNYKKEIGIAPHLYCPQFLDDDVEEERIAGMQLGLKLLNLCSKIYVIGDRISEGMKSEVEAAKILGVKIQRVVNVERFFKDK